MGDADHVAYEDAVAEWDTVEQLGFFLFKNGQFLTYFSLVVVQMILIRTSCQFV